jgi:hypothetical protein
VTGRVLPYAVMAALLTSWVPDAGARPTCPRCPKGQICQCIATCLPPLPCKGPGISCSCHVNPYPPKDPKSSAFKTKRSDRVPPAPSRPIFKSPAGGRK